jgi:hypothetical protein
VPKQLDSIFIYWKYMNFESDMGLYFHDRTDMHQRLFNMRLKGRVAQDTVCGIYILYALDTVQANTEMLIPLLFPGQ